LTQLSDGGTRNEKTCHFINGEIAHQVHITTDGFGGNPTMAQCAYFVGHGGMCPPAHFYKWLGPGAL